MSDIFERYETLRADYAVLKVRCEGMRKALMECKRLVDMGEQGDVECVVDLVLASLPVEGLVERGTP